VSEPMHVMFSNNGAPFQCSAYCPACAPERERLVREVEFASALAPFETLCRNLAMAGALCAAYFQGWGARHEFDARKRRTGATAQSLAEVWRPGCGRPRP
jgi:hypothetical protein